MSDYTREEILKLIEENGGSEGLDLSGKDLSGIDLNERAIEVELECKEDDKQKGGHHIESNCSTFDTGRYWNSHV